MLRVRSAVCQSLKGYVCVAHVLTHDFHFEAVIWSLCDMCVLNINPTLFMPYMWRACLMVHYVTCKLQGRLLLCNNRTNLSSHCQMCWLKFAFTVLQSFHKNNAHGEPVYKRNACYYRCHVLTVSIVVCKVKVYIWVVLPWQFCFASQMFLLRKDFSLTCVSSSDSLKKFFKLLSDFSANSNPHFVMFYFHHVTAGLYFKKFTFVHL